MEHKCGKCGTKHVRLHRPHGEFYSPERIKCNNCISMRDTEFYIPLYIQNLEHPYSEGYDKQNNGFDALPDSTIHGFTWGLKHGTLKGWLLNGIPLDY